MPEVDLRPIHRLDDPDDGVFVYPLDVEVALVLDPDPEHVTYPGVGLQFPAAAGQVPELVQEEACHVAGCQAIAGRQGADGPLLVAHMHQASGADLPWMRHPEGFDLWAADLQADELGRRPRPGDERADHSEGELEFLRLRLRGKKS